MKRLPISTVAAACCAALILVSCYPSVDAPPPPPVTPPNPVVITPLSRVVVGFNQSFQFNVNQPASWLLQQPQGGTITSMGLFTASDVPGVFTIRATSLTSSANFDTATVEVRAAAAPQVSPTHPVTTLGNNLNLTVNTPVNWSVIDVGGGSITTAGVYTPPMLPGTYRVRAQSQLDPALADTAFVRVNTSTNPVAYLRTGGYVILFRHTAADVCSDNTSGGPNWWRTCDANCATTTARQMNATGHADARLIGRALVNSNALVDSIHTSEFCRCFVGADSIRRQVGLSTAVVTQEPVLTFFVYDEANRIARTEAFARSRRLTAGRNRVMVSQAGHPSPPSGVLINMNNLQWGDAYILRQRGGGQRPIPIEIVPVATWRAVGQ